MSNLGNQLTAAMPLSADASSTRARANATWAFWSSASRKTVSRLIANDLEVVGGATTGLLKDHSTASAPAARATWTAAGDEFQLGKNCAHPVVKSGSTTTPDPKANLRSLIAGHRSMESGKE